MPQLFDTSAFVRSNDLPIVVELAVNESHLVEYQFGNQDVSGWTFTANTQTIILDRFQVRTDRDGNQTPAFGRIIGEIEDAMVVDPTNIDTTDAANGNIVLTVPPNRYTGNILPAYQGQVPITVLTLAVNDGNKVENRTILVVEQYAATASVDEPSENQNYDPIDDPPPSP